MTTIKRFGVLSFAKLHSLVFAMLGLLAGILYALGGFFVDLFVSLGWVSSPHTSGLSTGTILALGALAGMPLLFAAFGFVFGVLEAILLNLFARRPGGIRLDLELH